VEYTASVMNTLEMFYVVTGEFAYYMYSLTEKPRRAEMLLNATEADVDALMSAVRREFEVQPVPGGGVRISGDCTLEVHPASGERDMDLVARRRCVEYGLGTLFILSPEDVMLSLLGEGRRYRKAALEFYIRWRTHFDMVYLLHQSASSGTYKALMRLQKKAARMV